eukprot:COSAG01_NODE_51056_length_358_cov_0.583012_1_plen_73_part_01
MAGSALAAIFFSQVAAPILSSSLIISAFDSCCGALADDAVVAQDGHPSQLCAAETLSLPSAAEMAAETLSLPS